MKKATLAWIAQLSRPERPAAIATLAGVWLTAAVSLGAAGYLAFKVVDARKASASVVADRAALESISLTRLPAQPARYEALASALKHRFPSLSVSQSKTGEVVVESTELADYPEFEQALAFAASEGGSSRFEATELCTGKPACGRVAYRAVLRGYTWTVAATPGLSLPGAPVLPARKTAPAERFAGQEALK